MTTDETDPPAGVHADAGAPPVSEMIRRRLPELSRAERQVGRALLLRSPTIGLESSLRLAEIVGTSGPTVIRFVNRLGFPTYAAFQGAWRQELDARLVSPVDTYRRYEPETDAAQRVSRTVDTALEAIRQTIEQLPPDELDAAVDLLASRRRVLVFGGWFSHVLARHLVALLQGARPGVVLLEQSSGERAATLVDSSKNDVAVAFDFRRYEQPTFVAAQHLADRGCKLVLVTDQWVSPIAGLSSAVLIARTGPPSPLESLASATVLIEAVVAAVIDHLAPDVGERIGRLAEISATLIPNWEAPGPGVE